MPVKDYVALERKLQAKSAEKLDNSANAQQADDIALRMVKEIYEPIVLAIDQKYSIEVRFN